MSFSGSTCTTLTGPVSPPPFNTLFRLLPSISASPLRPLSPPPPPLQKETLGLCCLTSVLVGPRVVVLGLLCRPTFVHYLSARVAGATLGRAFAARPVLGVNTPMTSPRYSAALFFYDPNMSCSRWMLFRANCIGAYRGLPEDLRAAEWRYKLKRTFF